LRTGAELDRWLGGKCLESMSDRKVHRSAMA
jgi:hypothetical protein